MLLSTHMLRLRLQRTALTLFDAHFAVDEPNCQRLDDLFSSRFWPRTKLEQAFDDFVSLRIAHFRKNKRQKEASGNLVDVISKLNPLTVPSDRNAVVQKRLLKQAVDGTDWSILHETATKKSSSHSEVISQFVSTPTTKPHNGKARESGSSHCIISVQKERSGNHLSKKCVSKSILSAFEKVRKNCVTVVQINWQKAAQMDHVNNLEKKNFIDQKRSRVLETLLTLFTDLMIISITNEEAYEILLQLFMSEHLEKDKSSSNPVKSIPGLLCLTSSEIYFNATGFTGEEEIPCVMDFNTHYLITNRFLYHRRRYTT